MRFPGFEGEYELTELNELGEFLGGGTPSSSNENFWEGNIPWISSSDLIEDNIHSVKVSRFITEDAISNSATKLCQSPVILIVSRVGVGKIAYSEKSLCTSQDFLNIVNFKCNGIFLSYLLSIEMKKAASTVQGTSIKGISSSEIKSKKLFIPKDGEQQKIASFLTLIDERIQTQSKIINDLKTLKTTLSKKIFSQELRFKDDNGNSFPDWEKKKLKDITSIIMGQSPESSSYNIESIGVPLIQGNADILNRKSYPRRYTSRPTKLCEVGDILLTVRAPVGYVAKSFHEACIGRGVCVLKNKKNSIIEFIYQFLLYFENSWKSLEQGSTFTAVNSSDIGLVSMFFPSIPEQTKIANFLSSIDSKIDIEIQLSQKLEEQKKYLLQHMFV